MGSIVGVIHAVHLLEPTPPSIVEGLEEVSRQLGARVGVLTAMAQSQLQANTDPLTGLLNRRSLEHEVTSWMHGGVTMAVVFADLDHFKHLNDTHGHDMGDRALRLFARTLRQSMPDAAVVSRYGGEEFVVVLPDCTTGEAVRLFEGTQRDLELAFADGRVPPFTVSAGVVDNSANESIALDDLISGADSWLMSAKAAGRNRVLPASVDNAVPMPSTSLPIA